MQQSKCDKVVSNIFYVHPYLGKIPILIIIFQMGWNHQLALVDCVPWIYTFLCLANVKGMTGMMLVVGGLLEAVQKDLWSRILLGGSSQDL